MPVDTPPHTWGRFFSGYACGYPLALAPTRACPAPMDVPRLGGGISTNARVIVWHQVPMRSYFYLSERLSLEPANMLVLARYNMSKPQAEHICSMLARYLEPFIP